MKKNQKKQKLFDLNVVSFATTLNDKQLDAVQGGTFGTYNCTESASGCPTAGACSTSDQFGTICYSFGC